MSNGAVVGSKTIHIQQSNDCLRGFAVMGGALVRELAIVEKIPEMVKKCDRLTVAFKNGSDVNGFGCAGCSSMVKTITGKKVCITLI